ncbi:MAG: response regulator [Cellulosilyticaceae bacterium]
MNVLIVDDNRFVVKALETKLDWLSLKIDCVLTAYNINQAKKILLESHIDILISDIEMPQGSGLDLLAWIRNESLEIQTIFLTNYANFNYAQKAIELHSFEYYLKPIEFDKLTVIIQKAIQKVQSLQKTYLAEKGNELWEKNKSKLCQHFWDDCIHTKIHPSENELQNIICQHHLAYTFKDYFVIILITLFPYKLSDHNTVFSLMDDNREFESIFQSIVSSSCRNHHASYESLLHYKESKDTFALVLKIPTESCVPTFDISSICNTIISDTVTILGCSVRCDASTPCSFSDMYEVLQNLNHMNQNILDGCNKVFNLKQYVPCQTQYLVPNLVLLEQYLYTQDKKVFIKKCIDYLTVNATNGTLNHAHVCNFRIDITQLVYSYLKKNGILAHKLFQGDSYDLLFNQAPRSLEDLISYITYIISQSFNYIDFSNSQKSVVDTICEYIDLNLQNDITRSTLAEIVYLNPDYVTHIFKKEKGCSLSDYIIEKRVTLAKKLLQTTTLPISSIADKVGYDNYSHFTKLFKKKTSYTPLEYRKLVHEPFSV